MANTFFRRAVKSAFDEFLAREAAALLDHLPAAEELIMTFEHEQTPLPRGAGAEIPQSAVGPDGGLLYTEQNFNAIVAANAEMRGLLNGNADEIAALKRVISAQADAIATRDCDIANVRQSYSEMRDKMQNERSAKHALRANLEHKSAMVHNLQAQLERAKGYLDRVFDEEEQSQATYLASEGQPVPVRGARGPRLSEAPFDMPQARDGESMAYAMATITTADARRAY